MCIQQQHAASMWFQSVTCSPGSSGCIAALRAAPMTMQDPCAWHQLQSMSISQSLWTLCCLHKVASKMQMRIPYMQCQDDMQPALVAVLAGGVRLPTWHVLGLAGVPKGQKMPEVPRKQGRQAMGVAAAAQTAPSCCCCCCSLAKRRQGCWQCWCQGR